MSGHVEVLRKFRETGGVTTFEELDAALDHAIATIEQHAALVARLGELEDSYRRDAAGDDDWQACLETVADDLARVVKESNDG